MNKYIFKFKRQFISTIILKVISSVLWVYTAIVIQNIVDTAVGGNMDKFAGAVILSIVYFLSFVLLLFISDLVKSYYIKNTIQNLKKEIFNGTIHQSFKDFKSKASADYISNLTNDINLLENNYINPVVELIGEIFTFIATLFILLRISVPITIVLILTGTVMLLVPYLFHGSINAKQNRLSEDTSSFTGALKDLLDGFEVIKSYSMEETGNQEFDGFNNKLEKSRQKYNIFIALTEAISLMLSLVCQFSGVIMAGYFVLKGTLTVGVLSAVMQLGNGIFGPIQRIVQYITLIKGSKDLNAKLLRLISSKNNTEIGVTEFRDCIELKDISFSYNHDANLALDHVSLKLEKNKKYAVLGESGCGKSTLAKILLNYYTDYDGEICIDSKKLNRETDCSLMALSSMIHQNVYMFNKTIEENIVLGKKFMENAVHTAVQNSGLYRFLDTKGLDYQVGENGSRLSGGQKQRIAIARALVQNRPILVLDEATSALDKTTAAEIENSILENKNITVLTITHNMNRDILRKYDEVIVMDKGRIVEKGKFDELEYGKSLKG